MDTTSKYKNGNKAIVLDEGLGADGVPSMEHADLECIGANLNQVVHDGEKRC